MTMHCCDCGSDQVEELYTAWVDANNPKRSLEVVDRATTYLNKYWCRACDKHPRKLIDSMEFVPLYVSEVQRLAEAGKRTFFHMDHGMVTLVGYHLDDGATGFVESCDGERYDLVDLSCLRGVRKP